MNPTFVWYFFNDARPVEAKVRECAMWYKQRYGTEANLCLTHSDTMGEVKQVDGIELRASKSLQLNNFFITRADD